MGKGIIWGILVFFLAFVGSGFGEDKLAKPTADRKVENLIPLDFAKKIAIKRAREEWGEVAVGEPIIGCDKKGKVVVYIFPIKLNSQIFPSDYSIIRQIKEARKAHLIYQKFEKDKRDIEEVKKLRKRIWGVGEFGTIAIAARRNLHPIFEVSNVLPRYYTTGYLAKDKIRGKLGGVFKLNRLFYLSPLDQFYEFLDGEKKILINAFTLKILTPKDFQNLIEMRRIKAEKLKKEIPEKERKKTQEMEGEIKKFIEKVWRKYEEGLNEK